MPGLRINFYLYSDNIGCSYKLLAPKYMIYEVGLFEW